jgi:hypothetical protein
MIDIKVENGLKKINTKTIEEVLEGLNPIHTNINLIKDLFNNITSEDDLVKKLRLLKEKETPVAILLYIMYIGSFDSLYEANIIMAKVLE